MYKMLNYMMYKLIFKLYNTYIVIIPIYSNNVTLLIALVIMILYLLVMLTMV